NKVIGKCVKRSWEILLSIAIAIILFAGIAFADIPSWFNPAEDLKRWTKLLAQGDLSKDDFEWLIAGKKDLAEIIRT
ncbi:hypothetical protein LCGC14_3121460, partial [marine sediment metagenome]